MELLQTGQKSSVLLIFILQVNVGMYNPLPFNPSKAPISTSFCIDASVGTGVSSFNNFFHLDPKSTSEVIFFSQGSILNVALFSKT